VDAGVLKAIRSLLDTERVLAAAVLVDGEPVAALLPYAVGADYATLFVQASGLARHTKGLQPGAAIGVLVHAAATADRDPMQLPRLTVQATVTVLERQSEPFASAARLMMQRFPATATTLALDDFNLYALELGRGRYVEGFARAFNVGPETIRVPRR
jgi:putative heme iron utilization protein